MRKFLILALISIALAFTSFYISAEEITRIGEINASPINFDGKEVRLKGIPKDATRIPLVKLKTYVLEDDTGEITIFTSDDLPVMGEELSIRVRVESLAIIMGEPLGMTVVELERYRDPIEI
ncbi:MAG: hypothetical protein OEX82_03980 [Nitrosomonas sp.]|nr:hypothetical protein [Nitrosomonas sp.]